MRAKRFGYDEPGDVVGGIDHPVTLAPPCGAGGLGVFGFLAPRLRLKAFNVSDGLFKDMAKDSDGNFGRKVILAQGLETGALDGGEVNENVRAVFLLDEAKTFGFVEKLNGTGDHVRHIFNLYSK